MLLREYETIYIVRPDLPDDEIAQVNERLSNILNQGGAKLLQHDTWGKKKLAYEVKKHPKGIYVYLNYLGEPETIKEIERNLRLMEPVLKYQTIKLAENVDVERRLAEQEAANKARVAVKVTAKAVPEAEDQEEFNLDVDQDFLTETEEPSFRDGERDSVEPDESSKPEEEE